MAVQVHYTQQRSLPKDLLANSFQRETIAFGEKLLARRFRIVNDPCRHIKNVRVGKDVVIDDLVDLLDCEIGDQTKVHSFVLIQGGVRVGKRCKIEAGAFLCEGVTVKDDVFIGPQVVFTNDRHPRATRSDGAVKQRRDWELERTVVQRGASIGAGAKIMCGVKIGERSMIGLGSVVVDDVKPFAIVYGVPAKYHGDVREKKF